MVVNGYFNCSLFRKLNLVLLGESREILWYFPDKICASQRATCRVTDQNLLAYVSNTKSAASYFNFVNELMNRHFQKLNFQ